MTIPATNVSFSALAAEVQLPSTNISLNTSAVRYFANSAFTGEVSISSLLNKTALNNYLVYTFNPSATVTSGFFHLVKSSSAAVSGICNDQTTASYIGTRGIYLSPDGVYAGILKDFSTLLLAKRTLNSWATVQTISLPANLTAGGTLAWDNTSTYLAASVYSIDGTAYVPLKVWKRTADVLSELSLPTTTISGSSTTDDVFWSPNGGQVVVLTDGGGTSYPVQRYSRSGDVFTKLGTITNGPSSGNVCYNGAFNPANTLAYISYSNAGFTTYYDAMYTVSGTTMSRSQLYTDAAFNGDSMSFTSDGANMISKGASSSNIFYYFSVSSNTFTNTGSFSVPTGTTRPTLTASSDAAYCTALVTATSTSTIVYQYVWSAGVPTNYATGPTISGGGLPGVGSTSQKAVLGQA